MKPQRAQKTHLHIYLTRGGKGANSPSPRAGPKRFLDIVRDETKAFYVTAKLGEKAVKLRSVEGKVGHHLN